jgi:hypothetical protein
VGISKGHSKDGDANLTTISSNTPYFENAPSMGLYPTIKYKGSPPYVCIIIIVKGSKH